MILPDADVELAPGAIARAASPTPGQVCISVQRVIVHPAINGDFLDALLPMVKAIRYGDPSSPDTTMGTVISTAEARADRGVDRRRREGRRPDAHRRRARRRHDRPAVVADVDPSSPFSQDELFGPAVAVSKADDWESAIAQANCTAYGLAAGSSPRRRRRHPGDPRDRRRQHPHQLDAALARRPHALRRPEGSGIGKEGLRTAVSEMTEEKTIVLHGQPW